MAISNGYATLAEFKAYKDITSTDTTDDAVIEDIIEAASRYIDSVTGRTFYARTETRYYSLPRGRTLFLDDDLLTITTFTNGDSTTIASTEYHFLPKNFTPYFAVELKGSSTVQWRVDSSGNERFVLSIAGTWGYAASHPDDIKEACLQIATNSYGRRTGENIGGTATVTGAGVVITPNDISQYARSIMEKYRRLDFAFEAGDY